MRRVYFEGGVERSRSAWKPRLGFLKEKLDPPIWEPHWSMDAYVRECLLRLLARQSVTLLFSSTSGVSNNAHGGPLFSWV